MTDLEKTVQSALEYYIARVRTVHLFTHFCYFIAVVLQYAAIWSILRLYVPILTPRPVHFFPVWIHLVMWTALIWLLLYLLIFNSKKAEWIKTIDERLEYKDSLITTWEQINSLSSSVWNVAVYKQFLRHFNVKHINEKFPFRFPKKALLFSVVAIGMFILSNFMPYSAWRYSPSVKREITDFRAQVRLLQQVALLNDTGPEERKLIQKMKDLSTALSEDSGVTLENIDRISEIGRDYTNLLLSRSAPAGVGLRQTAEEVSVIDSLTRGANTSGRAKSSTVLSNSEQMLVTSIDILGEYALLLRERISSRSARETELDSYEVALSEIKNEQPPENTGTGDGTKGSSTFDPDSVFPLELKPVEKQYLTLEGLSIENQPVPWDRIPIWQERIVRDYFSNE